MDQAPRHMTLYNEFDTIAEPGRRPQPVFMRRTKTRRSKTALTLSILCVLLMVWGWKSSGITIVSVSILESYGFLLIFIDTHNLEVHQHKLGS